MSEVFLSNEEQEWVTELLEEWGAWALNGMDSETELNLIAKLMRNANQDSITTQSRKMCSDDVGLLISQIIGYYVKKPCPNDYRYIEAKYIYRCSVYAIAKHELKLGAGKSLRTLQRKITESIKASEWIISRYLDQALKAQPKLQKFSFYPKNI